MARLSRIEKLCLNVSSVALCAAAFVATPVWAEDTITEALQASKPILESRLRYESVDQPGLKEASAVTWRHRFGFQSAEYKNVKFLIEAEDVRAVQGDYNSNTNGKTAYAVVADPTVTELNRLQLTWTPSAYTTVVAGRQRIIMDDARFIGNVGWRQDEQTFDALKIDTSFGKVKVSYAYIFQVNRILAETADWDSDSHILNLTYTASEAFKLQVFDYALDFENSRANASNTYGVRATGNAWVSSFKLGYAAQYAKQSDYGYNPARFDLAEYMVEGTATYDIFTAKVNYESLEGNGTRGFTTPLATVHAFQGWSDVFNTGGNKTLPNGINDLSYSLIIAGHTKPELPYIINPTLTVTYHDMETQRLGQSIGQEWNLMATAGLTKNLSLMLKYADFERANTNMPASRTKIWVGLEYKL